MSVLNENNLKPSMGDISHTAVRAALSAIPIVGGPAVELFSAVITPPLSKRRDAWIKSIADGLVELQNKVNGFRIENLSKNDLFITTVAQASQAAIRNHHKEKLDALRNAVLNAALPNSPNEDLQLIFLNLIDITTTWHLKVLEFFDNPVEVGQKKDIRYPNWTMGGPATALEYTFSELRDRRDFYDQIVKDLYARGLLNMESLHVMMTGKSMLASRTTPMGKQFLAFIRSPL